MRPDSSQKKNQNLTENQSVEHAISVGFVRAPEQITLFNLRQYITDLCDQDNNIPKDFIYLRSVGRCLTKVKRQQENELKVKCFRPPITNLPEIYLLGECFDSKTSNSANKTSIEAIKIDKEDQKRNEKHSYVENKSIGNHLQKLHQERERVYLRQLDLATKHLMIDEQIEKFEQAAILIQTAYRKYRLRSKEKERPSLEIENGKPYEKKFSDVNHLSRRLKEIQERRIDLQTNRELILCRMQRIKNDLRIRRDEERYLWKQKYLLQKKEHLTDFQYQLESAEIQLKDATKLRLASEYHARLLRYELKKITLELIDLERHRLLKESSQNKYGKSTTHESKLLH